MFLPLREIMEIMEICFLSYFLLTTGMANLGNLNKSMYYLPPAVVLSYLLSLFLLSPKDGFMDYRRRRGNRAGSRWLVAGSKQQAADD